MWQKQHTCPARACLCVFCHSRLPDSPADSFCRPFFINLSLRGKFYFLLMLAQKIKFLVGLLHENVIQRKEQREKNTINQSAGAAG
jgi:hypothetical protein